MEFCLGRLGHWWPDAVPVTSITGPHLHQYISPSSTSEGRVITVCYVTRYNSVCQGAKLNVPCWTGPSSRPEQIISGTTECPSAISRTNDRGMITERWNYINWLCIFLLLLYMYSLVLFIKYYWNISAITACINHDSSQWKSLSNLHHLPMLICRGFLAKNLYVNTGEWNDEDNHLTQQHRDLIWPLEHASTAGVVKFPTQTYFCDSRSPLRCPLCNLTLLLRFRSSQLFSHPLTAPRPLIQFSARSALFPLWSHST